APAARRARLRRMYPLTRRDLLHALVCSAGCFLLAALVAFPRDRVALFFYDARDISPDGRFVNGFLPVAADPWNAQTPNAPPPRPRALGPALAHSPGLRGPAAELLLPLADLPLFAAVYLCVRRRLPPRDAALATALSATTLAALTSMTWLGF